MIYREIEVPLIDCIIYVSVFDASKASTLMCNLIAILHWIVVGKLKKVQIKKQ